MRGLRNLPALSKRISWTKACGEAPAAAVKPTLRNSSTSSDTRYSVPPILPYGGKTRGEVAQFPRMKDSGASGARRPQGGRADRFFPDGQFFPTAVLDHGQRRPAVEAATARRLPGRTPRSAPRKKASPAASRTWRGKTGRPSPSARARGRKKAHPRAETATAPILTNRSGPSYRKAGIGEAGEAGR